MRGAEERNAKGDLKQIREINCLHTFDEFASEALPYWIERAERLGCALRLACEMVASCTDCPGAQDDWPGCGGTAEKCSDDEPDCWKRYFLEEGGQDQ